MLVISDSLQPHGLYSPWNCPGQNSGMGSLSLLQGILPTLGSNPGLPHCRWILYQLSCQGSHKIQSPVINLHVRVLTRSIFLTLCDTLDCNQLLYWSGLSVCSSGDLPDPGVKPTFLCLLHCRQILYPLSHQ